LKFMASRKREKTKPEDIKNIINSVIEKIEKQGPGKKEKILDAWKKAAGEDINGHSRPVSVRREVLTIEVDSSTWFYAINLKKRDIMKRLNNDKKENDIKIKSIKLRMGEIT
jgi:hypothetical protein